MQAMTTPKTILVRLLMREYFFMLPWIEERFSVSIGGGTNLGGRGEGEFALRGPPDEPAQGNRGDFGPLLADILLVLHGNRKVSVVKTGGRVVVGEDAMSASTFLQTAASGLEGRLLMMQRPIEDEYLASTKSVDQSVHVAITGAPTSQLSVMFD